MKPTLYIFSGLPGTGKTTLARELARIASAAYVRIDSIEQGLRDLCEIKVVDEGYRLAYAVAADNLAAGISVVADSVNPVAATREAWIEVATSAGADFVNVEIFCSDPQEHRHRVEHRQVGIKNLTPPSWDEVVSRHYQAWSLDRVRIDTAGKSIKDSVTDMMGALVG